MTFISENNIWIEKMNFIKQKINNEKCILEKFAFQKLYFKKLETNDKNMIVTS